MSTFFDNDRIDTLLTNPIDCSVKPRWERKALQTKNTPSKTPSKMQDRFIPNRAAMDMTVSHFELTNHDLDPENPAANASPYEKLVFEKPAIKAYVDRLYNKGDINGANIFMEYINDPQQAQNRYGKEADYQAVFAKADELMAAPAFTSAKLAYSGFPMMGEDGLRGQMEYIGAVNAFSLT